VLKQQVLTAVLLKYIFPEVPKDRGVFEMSGNTHPMARHIPADTTLQVVYTKFY
jgi:hypothetical protein